MCMKKKDLRKCNLSANYSWKQKPGSHVRHLDSATVEIMVNEEEYLELLNNPDARVRRFIAAVSPQYVVSIKDCLIIPITTDIEYN